MMKKQSNVSWIGSMEPIMIYLHISGLQEEDCQWTRLLVSNVSNYIGKGVRDHAYSI
jgi:hypothetical protein